MGSGGSGLGCQDHIELADNMGIGNSSPSGADDRRETCAQIATGPERVAKRASRQA